MQDVVAGDLGRAVARDQRERIQRHRRVADIADVVLDGEEIAVVDRNGAAEGEAFAIVVFQRHRVGRRQGAGAFLLPQRVLVGHPHRRAASPAPSRIRHNRGARSARARTARSPAISDRRCRGIGSARRSSMRAPFSEMLPVTRGVSILMRGAAAIAASRLTTGPEPGRSAGWPRACRPMASAPCRAAAWCCRGRARAAARALRARPASGSARAASPSAAR